MPAPKFDLDDILDSEPPISESGPVVLKRLSNGSYVEPEYTGKIDYRIRQLSYSAGEVLASCQRKFQLNRLKSSNRTEVSEESNITFAFGHVVGDGIQKVFEGKSEQEIIWAMYLGWHAPLFAKDERRHKSFWSAVIAIQKFISLRQQGFLDEYELVYFNGRPATELDFCINFPDGFRFRGSVDVVLKHKITGEVTVIECKTTWQKEVNPNQFRHSRQALGYSVVLDVIYPGLSSYKVLYLVYQTTTRDFTPIPFTKSSLQRAMWIREMLFDIELIKTCEEQELYPMRSSSCLDFNKECEYMDSCTLSTHLHIKPITVDDMDKKEYQINLTLMDLLNAQLNKLDTY
jgi:hypothetical protein